jgi:predicted aconitase with swiveling domain
MKLFFKGRAVLPGTTEGPAMVTHSGFNTYASFFTSIHAPTKHAICADSVNQELFGKDLAGKIICLPKTTGSTSGGAVWQRLSRMGNTPRAMLFSQKIDSLAAGGLIIADIWAGKRLITVDQLGNKFLETVEESDWITIYIDGTVEIVKPD